MSSAENPLPGGNMSSGVVRVGDTVRRPTGPWTPAVHALLVHLNAVGFCGAPRPLGFDEQGREVLSYPWYAWMLVAAATAVSVALNVAHAPERLAAQLFAALPPVALLGALELLMSVARTGLPHAGRTQGPTLGAVAAGAALDPVGGNGHRNPTTLTLPQDRTSSADQDPSAAPDARAQVRMLVARERSGGPLVTAPEVVATTGRSRRRAYELLRDARIEQE